jgi:hypothetical protein
MKRKIDTIIDRRVKRKKSRKRLGGKALQRLFAYLGERDPRLNSEIVARMNISKNVRPQFGLTVKTSGAKRARRVPTAASSSSTKGSHGRSTRFFS